MQFIRTTVWVFLAVVLVAFVAINWEAVPVNFWPLADGTYLHFNWPVGFTALVFFFLGLLPMWLLNKAGRWRLNRRINTLENTVRAVTPAPPLATATQLEAAQEPAS
jgi:lipopolysaccharide assembly protein A